jgi:hypothetical protein
MLRVISQYRTSIVTFIDDDFNFLYFQETVSKTLQLWSQWSTKRFPKIEKKFPKMKLRVNPIGKTLT